MSSTISSQTPLPAPIPAGGDEVGPLVGRHFGGYEVTSYIGEGPTGAVYRAEDLMGSRLALKVMHRELSHKDHAEALFADLKKLAAIDLPQLPRIYDGGFSDDGQFYFAQDELVGSDLDAGLEESGALAPQKALEIVRQVCDALEAAHQAGVVHGGLKPRNIFLVPAGDRLTVKVLDFAATRLAGGLDKGVIVGNPFYMAPEQFGGNADARTDVYALGILMYELFSGTLPFQGPSHGQVMMRHLAEVPQPPPGCDEELQKIILRALVKAPSGRYASVKQLRLALERWAQSMPAMLTSAAGQQVIARAKESQAIKQAALCHPDATTPMPKLDLAELARGTRREKEPVPPMSPTNKRPQNGERPSDLNSPESVEASLEDFISQANASFPTTTSDGWDLHTGDVELLDEAEEQLEQAEHVAAPAQVRQPEPAKRPTSRSMPAVAPLPKVEVEPEPEPEPLDPPPSAPRRKFERTEVVSQPMPLVAPSVPWTANPLVIIGGLLVAFVIGAGIVFFMVRTMMPATQPVVVTAPAPAPVVVPQAQAAPAQPVVTPLPTPPAAQPAVGQPVVTPLPAEEPAAQPEPVAVAPAPIKRTPAVKRAAAPKAQAAPKAEKPAAKPASAPKKESKSSDWVDPFAD